MYAVQSNMNNNKEEFRIYKAKKHIHILVHVSITCQKIMKCLGLKPISLAFQVSALITGPLHHFQLKHIFSKKKCIIRFNKQIEQMEYMNYNEVGSLRKSFGEDVHMLHVGKCNVTWIGIQDHSHSE